MAQPTVTKFGKMVVSLGDTATPTVYAAPCGLSTKGFVLSKNSQEITIPDCVDPDAPMWIGRSVQNLSANVSGDGVAAAESVPDWNAAAISTDSVPMKVEITFTGTGGGVKSFEGKFVVDNLTFGAEQGGFVTLSFNAQSDGEVVDTWTPTP
jgi:predicted secreted protein